MKNEILWFIRLGREQNLFTREQALGVMKAVGRDAELMDFAQKLIDDEIVSDVDKLEAIAGNAMARAQVGPPDGTPLLDDPMPPMPVASARPTAPATAASSSIAAAPQPKAASMP